MTAKWNRARSAYDFLRANNGQVVTAAQIAEAAGWTVVTARTYIAKLWAGLLEPQAPGFYEIRLPESLGWSAFQGLHTQVVLTPLIPTPETFEYDVALSFAGEDRPYVSQVAEVLRAYGIRVFYDVYEQHSLWGKDLYTHLDEVYRLRSRYCVMFLSKHYRDKLWTDHERKSAQDRAFKAGGEYILPVRLDGTEIPGARSTTGYVDGRTHSATEIANMVSAKLGMMNDLTELIDIFKRRLPLYEAQQQGPDLVFENPAEGHTVRLSILMLREALRAHQLDLFTESSIFVQ